MKLKSKLLLALLATSSAAFAQTAPAAPAAPEVTYNVGVVSQYRYRGIAQTHGDPALQGGIDYANANGFYMGAWGSTIKWIKDNSAVATATKVEGNIELDLYGGYKFEAAGLAYDVGYLRYQYIGNTLEKTGGVNKAVYTNANTDELYGAVTAGVFTAKYSYSMGDLFGNNNSKGSSYIDLSATFDLGDGYTLVPHIGRQTIPNQTAGTITGNAADYTDVALTLAKDLGNGLVVSAAAVSTTAYDQFYNNGNGDKKNIGKSAAVIGLKYSF